MMKRERSILLILLFFILSCCIALAQWTQVRTGIEYRKFTLSDPNNVFVTRLDRSNLNCIIDSCIAQGQLISGKERVSGMATRYDDTIGYWGQAWGARYDVVAAINGDGFSTDQPTNGQIISGWYAKRFNEFGGGGFAWKIDRDVFMGGCVNHRGYKNILSYPRTADTQEFTGINKSRGSDDLIIYTPQWGTNTATNASGVEVLVEMTTPLLIKPTPNYCTGYVRQVRQNQGSTPIPFDHIVLSATDSQATQLLSNVSAGDEVHVSLEITHYMDDCSTSNPNDWTKTYCSIGFMTFIYLKDGVVVQTYTNPAAYNREPRTAVAYNDNYIFFIVCDGRSAISRGMTMPELGDFCKNQLVATWGINQDGGGSSTLWVDGAVKNSPSDGAERYVTNGLMMISVIPMSQSTSFLSGDKVITLAMAGIRLGPGTNYGTLWSTTAGQEGVILAHTINGVFAKGQSWWKCSFGSYEGWISENSLVPKPTSAGRWAMYE
jgi:hypothetical protein